MTVEPLAVSIHAPVKGAIVAGVFGLILVMGFNPRTREGCDTFRVERLTDHKVSIHAPVKGAIVFLLHRATQCAVSIHAPVKGAMAPPSL